MFTESFGRFVYDGAEITCEVDGFTITARVERDDSSDAPWERGDGHGPVSGWTSRDKAPGERVLKEDRGSFRYYDFAEAVRIAKAEGWDAAPFGEGTKRQRAARAVEADFRNLKAWCGDEWFFCGVCVTVGRAGVQLTERYEHALWGIESNEPEYLLEVANELLDDALAAARERAAEIVEELTEEV